MLPTRIRALDLSIPKYDNGLREMDGLPIGYPNQRRLNGPFYASYMDYYKEKLFARDEVHLKSAGTIAYSKLTNHRCFLQEAAAYQARANVSNDSISSKRSETNFSSESSKREDSDSESNWSGDENAEQNNIDSGNRNTNIEEQPLPDSTVRLISNGRELCVDDDDVIVIYTRYSLGDNEVSDRPTPSMPKEADHTDSVVDSTTCDEQISNLDIETATPEEIVDSHPTHCPDPINLLKKTSFDCKPETYKELPYESELYRESRDHYYSSDEYDIRPPTPPKPKGTYSCESIAVASDYSFSSDDLDWCKKNAKIRPITPPKCRPDVYPTITILNALDELKDKVKEQTKEGSEQDKEKDGSSEVDLCVKRPRLE